MFILTDFTAVIWILSYLFRKKTSYMGLYQPYLSYSVQGTVRFNYSIQRDKKHIQRDHLDQYETL